MKSKLNILLIAVTMLMGTSVFTACSDDDFTATIFNTDPSIDYLDKSSYTFPLDTFCKKEFLEPYNIRFIYRLEDIGSDMQKNLVPASYEKSLDLAVLSKYLWYDVYKKVAGETFLKLYSPRIIHAIGSPAYNPTSGTETLGTAEGGLKITLYKVNSLNVNDLSALNNNFFVTMHHEFGHILDQTFQRPSEFNTISAGNYNLGDWGNTHDSIAVCRGFVTPYASSQAREDWVETMAHYITMDTVSWNRMLNSASYDWEEIDCTETDYNKYDKMYKGLGVESLDSIGILKVTANGEHKLVRKVIARNADGSVAYNDEGKLQYLEQDGIDGRAVILQKLEMVRAWLKDNWNIDIETLRYEVQHRQYVYNADGTLSLQDGSPINKLTQPYEGDNSMSLIQYLRTWVKQYEALQVKY